MNFKIKVFVGLVIFVVLLFYSCSATKFVPDGEYLLADAKVQTDVKGLSDWELRSHVKQKPNFKTFEVMKLPLSIYNLSGRDSTKWINRTLRKAGEAPVIYDSTQVTATVSQLQKVMFNKGYLDADITPEIKFKKKKVKVLYDIKAGSPYKIQNYRIRISDSILSQYDTLSYVPKKYRKQRLKQTGTPTFNVDTVLRYDTYVSKNSNFDLDLLDKERDRLTYRLRRSGYYGMNKNHIGFIADTTIGNHGVDLELAIQPYLGINNNTRDTISSKHLQYEIASVDLYVDYNPIESGSLSNYTPSSVYQKGKYRVFYGERGRFIRPFIILEKCFIKPGSIYDEEMTSLTYTALGQLKILKNINISYDEFWENGKPKLHCIITCVPDKRHGITTELEGTHSGGFFGIGAGVGYSHKNIFKGSELFTIKVKGSYEAMTPNFTKFSDNYFELGTETSLTFPRFLFPFINRSYRKRVQASTQLNAEYVIQRRPKFFERTILATGMKYIWQERHNSQMRHAIDLVNVSYVHLPQTKLNYDFVNSLSHTAQEYSFKDHFIISTGYSFTKTNSTLKSNQLRPLYSLRGSVETAGNILSGIAKATKAKKDDKGSRELFGTPFAQYIRATFDYSKTYFFDEKNSLAWHTGGGIAYPYGNSKLIPIQKRFFSGGANGVRGWAVRELGPGSYYNTDSKRKDNFYNHSGDIRFDANIEYRSKLFWVLELGMFLDAGNIWTTRTYEGQEGGKFQFNRFYKEIALAWGLGIRLDFDFVLVRLDCGWKVYDPTKDPNKSHWPIKRPYKFGPNTAWHIAVGYPF